MRRDLVLEESICTVAEDDVCIGALEAISVFDVFMARTCDEMHSPSAAIVPFDDSQPSRRGRGQANPEEFHFRSSL